MSNLYNRNHAVAYTNEDIYRFAPSVFAVNAHESRSDRFKPIATIEILDRLREEGFEVVSATQSRTRDSSKRDYTKHMLRLRHVNDLANVTAKDKLTDTHAEIVLKNANDGSAAYQLHAGAYRTICANGLIAMTDLFDCIKVRHSGSIEKIAHNVIEGTFTVLEETNKMLGNRNDWAAINMSDEARMAFAEAAHVIRFGDSEGKVETPIKPSQLLTPRRAFDRATDLWTVYNVVQENAIKGGMRAYDYNKERFTSAREVKGIDQDVKLNKALYKLADYFAQQVKSAA